MRSTVLSCLVLSILVNVTACSGAQPSTEAPAYGEFPLALENCGTQVDVIHPPERVVTIKSTSTEMLLSLGLEERLIATAFEDSPLPESLAHLAEGIPVVSDSSPPSQEVLLELEPDFVYAGWESNFSPETAGERNTLHQLGVGTYVSPAACRGEGQPSELSFDDVFANITEIGALFGVPDAASELVAEQQAMLDKTESDNEGRTVLWYSSGTDTPYVGAGSGAPAMIMDELGLDNIAGDIDDAWTEFSWEAIVDANPEVLILIDSEWNTAEDKIERLEKNPVTVELDAVKSENYLILPFAASEAGVRNAHAVVDLSEQLRGADL